MHTPDTAELHEPSSGPTLTSCIIHNKQQTNKTKPPQVNMYIKATNVK